MAVALIVAAGRGERLGTSVPKAFVLLRGVTLLERSLRIARAAVGVTSIVVARPPGTAPLEHVASVAGGGTRSESVRLALAAAPEGEDEVVVHDAARPLAPPDLFDATLAALADADAAIAAAPMTDTIKEVDGAGIVLRTLHRAGLRAVQTPQAFRRPALERALDVPDEVLGSATDDAWLVERMGGRVVVVDSPSSNIKVTTPFDLQVAELMLG